MKKLITLSFLPSPTSCGILFLRLWFGAAMFLIHGIDKVKDFKGTIDQMAKGGIPSYLAVAAILAEALGSLALIVGFGTRWAALVLGTTMGVAFFHAHEMKLKGPGSGEMAFLYLGVFAFLFVVGGGRYSIDAKLSSKPTIHQ